MIEVDVTSPSLNRFPIFAAFGVPEVWRYDGLRVVIFRLSGADYREAGASGIFPALTSERATEFLEASQRLNSLEWLRQVRQWARQTR